METTKGREAGKKSSPLASSVISLELGSNRLNESSLILVRDALPLSDPLLGVGRRKTDGVEVLVCDGKGDEGLQSGKTERGGGGEKVVQVGETVERERTAREVSGRRQKGGDANGLSKGERTSGTGLDEALVACRR